MDKFVLCITLLLICGSMVNASLMESMDKIVSQYQNSDNVLIVYGQNQNYNDFHGAAIISGQISSTVNFSRFPRIVSDKDVPYSYDKNLILIGGPCSNSLSAKYLETQGITCSDWKQKPGEAILKHMPESHEVIIIAGSDDLDTLAAAKFLKYYNTSIVYQADEIIHKNTLSISRALRIIITDYQTNDDVMIVASDRGASNDVPAALKIANYMYTQANTPSVRFFPRIKFPNQINQLESKNLILIGGPCANRISEEITNQEGYNCDDWRFSQNESVIKLFMDGSRLVMLIAGTSADPGQTLNLISAIKEIENHHIFEDNSEVVVHDNGSMYTVNRVKTVSSEECTGWFCKLRHFLQRESYETTFSGDNSDDNYNDYLNQDRINRNCYTCFMELQSNDFVFDLIDGLSIQKHTNDFAEAEKRYIIGRITDNKELICSSLDYYKRSLKYARSKEDDLVIYENILFLSSECSSEREQYYYLSIVLGLSKEIGYEDKYKVYSQIFQSEDLSINVEPYTIPRDINKPRNPSKIILGRSYIIVDENSQIGMQVERTTRDWLSSNIGQFPNHAPDYSRNEGIQYMEGDIAKRIMQGSGATAFPLPNTLIVSRKEHGVKWYAADEKGNFRFEVLPDKVWYPTTKCIKNVCLLVDTHGISSLVAKALIHNLTAIIGCGDYYDKMTAAVYLANRGIDVIYPCDRFAGEVLGYYGSGTLLGTAPVRKFSDYSVIGNQSVEIDLKEKIVIQTTKKAYPVQYYDAPDIYFSNLEKIYGLRLNKHKVATNNIGETGKVVETAIKENSQVIAVRVAVKEDYEPVKDWLQNSYLNRAILFHSAPFSYGYRLFDEFPSQTSFGDPKPIFE